MKTKQLSALAVAIAETLTQVITFYCDQSKQASCQFKVSDNALDQFVIKGKVHKDADFETLYADAGSYTGVVGLLESTSGDLTTVGAGAIGSFVMNVSGYYEIGIYAASGNVAGSEIDAYVSLVPL